MVIGNRDPKARLHKRIARETISHPVQDAVAPPLACTGCACSNSRHHGLSTGGHVKRPAGKASGPTAAENLQTPAMKAASAQYSASARSDLEEYRFEQRLSYPGQVTQSNFVRSSAGIVCHAGVDSGVL